MAAKVCFKCKKEKNLDDFYKHKGCKDGHLNKCKDCTKSDAAGHRERNIEAIREYDRNRGNRQPKGYLAEFRAKYPNKYKAHTLVNNALRDGKMKKEPCIICGSTESVHGHHDDYAFPLNVRWLCAAHHHQWHAEYGEALNP